MATKDLPAGRTNNYPKTRRTSAQVQADKAFKDARAKAARESSAAVVTEKVAEPDASDPIALLRNDVEAIMARIEARLDVIEDLQLTVEPNHTDSDYDVA